MKSFEGSPTRVSDEEEVAPAPVEAAAPEMIRVTDDEVPAGAKVENYVAENPAKEYSGDELAEVRNAIPETHEPSKDEKIAGLKEELSGKVEVPDNVADIQGKVAWLEENADREDAIKAYHGLQYAVERKQDDITRFAEAAEADPYAKLSDEQLAQQLQETEAKTNSLGHKARMFFGGLKARMQGRMASSYATDELKAASAMRSSSYRRDQASKAPGDLEELRGNLAKAQAGLDADPKLAKYRKEDGTYEGMLGNATPLLFDSASMRENAAMLREEAEKLKKAA